MRTGEPRGRPQGVVHYAVIEENGMTFADELRYYLTAIFLNLPSKMKSEFSSYARDFCEEGAVA